MTYKNQNILVVGLGLSGQSACRFLLHHGAKVHAVDSNPFVLKNEKTRDLKAQGVTLLLEADMGPIEKFDLIVLSPGIPPTHSLYQIARQSNINIMGEIELGCGSLVNPVIGVTGTNGKTTVTSLITHILNASGRKARAIGNFGFPITEAVLLNDPQEIFVLELSSFQLDTLSQVILDAAIILNITPDHLDRYGNMDAYAKSKFSIQKCLKKEAWLYLEENTQTNYHRFLQTKNVRSYGLSPTNYLFANSEGFVIEGVQDYFFKQSETRPQSHDLENLMAAYALCREFGVSESGFRKGFATFKKPPHRIECILEINGVTYYDDSKGTNIDAVGRAVHSLNGSVILIAGGYDKGANYSGWIESFANRVKYVCAIGQTADKIKKELSPHLPVQIFATLEQATHYAATIAQKGDNVLLSPGCASWDMFKDYTHRGKEFQRIVRQL